MAITITYGKITSSRPANTNEAQLYVVPASTQINGLVRVCNQDSSNRTFRIAHTTAGHGDVAADGDDWLFYDTTLIANQSTEISVHLNATETLRIQASVADKLSFHLSGEKRVTS